MKKLIAAVLLLFWTILAFCGDKYPLTMTAVFTQGKSINLSQDATYQSGDYECTPGDEHHAPECHTIQEWANIDAMGGDPDTVVFTMADGSKVGVQSESVKKIPGFVECGVSTPVIFCNLYVEFLTRQQVDPTRKTQYGQTEYMSADEMLAAEKERTRELFGNGNTMTLNFRYKLVGKPKDGFQRIKIDKSSCITDEHKINLCDDLDLGLLNPRGDGYIINAKVAKQN